MTRPPEFWNNDTVRQVERDSIRAFVVSCSDAFDGGTVLDYGCGQQPYRSIVEEAGGDYHGYDRVGYPGNVSREDVGFDPWTWTWHPTKQEFEMDGQNRWDAILCNQILQFVDDVPDLLSRFYYALRENGYLVLTYGTNWAEVENTDLHRHTRAGIRKLLEATGFDVIRNESRAEIDLGGFRLSLGGGALARATP